MKPVSVLRNINRYSVLALIVLLLAVAVRLPVLNTPMAGYSDNEDATSHVLATMVAYGETSPLIHKFLPLFTLGASSDKFINDLPTASRFDQHGNVYYTSWPPGLFLFPYTVAKVLHVVPSPAFIRLLNMALQALCCWLLAMLCAGVAGGKQETRWVAGSLGCMLYAAAPEALKSHFFGYWAESLYGPILIAQLILFARNRIGWLFFVLALAGGLIDWTAYIANTGFLLAFSYLGLSDRRHFRLALFTAGSNILAVALLLSWFTTVLPINELLSAQRHRAGVRMEGNYLDLLTGYFSTLGPFILFIVLFLLYRVRRFWTRRTAMPDSVVSDGSRQRMSLLVFVSLFPLVENLILVNHAATYTYDRLKMLPLIAITISFLVRAFPRERNKLAALGCVISLCSIAAFAYHNRVRYTHPDDPGLSIELRLGELIRRTAERDALLFSTAPVRGHTLFYSGHNLYSIGERGIRSPEIPIEDFVRETLRSRGFAQGQVYVPSPDRRTTQIWYVPASVSLPIRQETIQLFTSPQGK